MSGDCFVVAARIVIDDHDLVLVHGLPAMSSGPHKGKRHWHAWVERVEQLRHPDLPHPIEITTVIDRSNGKGIEVPAEQYYKIGDIKSTWRYPSEEAVKRMLATGHFGPWVDDPEGVDVVS